MKNFTRLCQFDVQDLLHLRVVSRDVEDDLGRVLKLIFIIKTVWTNHDEVQGLSAFLTNLFCLQLIMN